MGALGSSQLVAREALQLRVGVFAALAVPQVIGAMPMDKILEFPQAIMLVVNISRALQEMWQECKHKNG